MAKVFHVRRPPDCSKETFEAELQAISAEGGTVVSVVNHASTAGGEVGNRHDNRWCLIDIVYTTGA